MKIWLFLFIYKKSQYENTGFFYLYIINMKIERFNESNRNRKKNYTDRYFSFSLQGTRRDDNVSIMKIKGGASLDDCLEYYNANIVNIKRQYKDIFVERAETINKHEYIYEDDEEFEMYINAKKYNL